MTFNNVLILVVVEDGLVLYNYENYYYFCSSCLNPCCSGRWSRTQSDAPADLDKVVLILVVVEDGLVLVTELRLLV